ncbi:MAG: methionine adenosyltransferase [Lachnospirales bacterium]
MGCFDGKERNYYVTSESVTEGHPDKLCDQIADGILDAHLEKDPLSRVAIEVMVSKNTVMIAGEVTSTANIDVTKIAKKIIHDVGYTEKNKGFDSETCIVIKNINCQSRDISMGVTKDDHTIGGGDQGIMYGYAVDETENYMPLPCDLANKLAERLAYVRKSGMTDMLEPDGKSQVTMLYSKEGKPIAIHSIVISTQHKENVSKEVLDAFIRYSVIEFVVPKKWITCGTKIHINPTGRFVIGGPCGDTGVTGRKLMVDTYGTLARHGGGAFSGKDSTKVDRSAAYMARYVAKNIVAASIASKCEVSFAYVIGGIKPEAIRVNTFSTGIMPDRDIEEIVKNVFDLEVVKVIKNLDLRKPIFLKTASYGHFGRENLGFKWENIDKVKKLKEFIY